MVGTSINGDYVDVAGLRTFYVQRGTGYPVVVVHGGSPGACALVNWGGNLDALAAAGLVLYAYDQPGYGRTEVPSDLSMEYRVQHAKAFIDGLGFERYHLMGNSQGSYIAARIAMEDDRVDRLVLVSSGTLAPKGSPAAEALARKHAADLGAYEPGLENMRKLSLGTLYHPELVTDEFVQLRYEMSIGPLREAAQARRNTPAARPILDELSRLKPPTLLLWG
ncbi:MAG: alpha/beta fold hydrolase, partial [Chloroflexi bacterium]|nr:alpha/beta fold hydrolase [Chloroflexota bacterium]